MAPITSRWLFIAVIALVIWRLIPLSTEQELASANRAWRTGHFDEATRIWSPLAEQGQPRAQALMGWSHEVGQGSEQDISRAITLYRQAAQAGMPSANTGSGRCTCGGRGEAGSARGVSLDGAGSQERRCARHVEGGRAASDGVRGRVDLPRAKEWLYQAAKQGNQLALKVLQELELAQEGAPRSTSTGSPCWGIAAKHFI